MRAAATVFFILALPVFLISTNLWLAVNDIRLYEYGFERYDVPARTGLSQSELSILARDMIDYYHSDAEFLESELFGDREIAHMKDVKGLVQLSYTVMLGAAAYIGIFAVAYLAWKRREAWRYLSRNLVLGGIATVGILAVLGLWAVLAFDSLFLLFHLVSFRNDLWQLSPGDYLLRLFPQGFFNDATLFVAGAVVVEVVFISGIAWFFSPLRRAGSRESSSPKKGSPGPDARLD